MKKPKPTPLRKSPQTTGELAIPRLRIPVFVSCPSHDNLSAEQQASARMVFDLIEGNKLGWHALGRHDYPQDLPLREVLRMIKHCSGGLILGFKQFETDRGTFKVGAKKQEKVTDPICFGSPWNQLEGGILFNQEPPIMIFREPGLKGGIFDVGTAELFFQDMPTPQMSASELDRIEMVFQRWASRVKMHYYGPDTRTDRP